MFKVLFYDIKEGSYKYRRFKTRAEADHYANVLKYTAFNVTNPPPVFIDVMPV